MELVEWSALFYIFVLAKHFKEINPQDYGGLGMLSVTNSFSFNGRWMGCIESFFYVGHFLFFVFFFVAMTIVPTNFLIPHWLISDYFGYHYQILNTASYAGFIWVVSAVTLESNRGKREMQNQLDWYKNEVKNLEKEIKKGISE
jgi:hypothetical protein